MNELLQLHRWFQDDPSRDTFMDSYVTAAEAAESDAQPQDRTPPFVAADGATVFHQSPNPGSAPRPQSREQKYGQVRNIMKKLDADDVDAPSATSYQGFVDRVVDHTVLAAPQDDSDTGDEPLSRLVDNLQQQIVREEDHKREEDELFEVTRQKVQNLKLKARVIEGEEALQQLHQDHVGSCETQRHDVFSRHREGQKALEEFDSNTKWAILAKYMPQNLCKDAQLALTLQQVQEYLAYVKPEVEGAKRMLDEVRSPETQQKREFLEQELLRCGPLFNTDVAPRLAMPIYDMLHSDVLSADGVRDQLQQTQKHVRDLQTEIEDLDRGREQAVAEDELTAAEHYHDQSIRGLEELTDVIRGRLQILNGTGGDVPVKSTMGGYLQKATAQLDEIKRQEGDLRQLVVEDMRRLEAKARETHNDDEKKANEFEIFQQTNTRSLEENAQRQDTIMEKVVELYKELLTLGDERWEEVNKRVEATEREQKRRVELGQSDRVLGDHREALSDLLKYLDQCRDVTVHLESFVTQGLKDIEDRCESTQTELKDLLLDEQRNYLAVFRRYYLTSGELLFKKERRMQELQRRTRNATMQAEIARDTLDPQAKVWKEHSKELQRDLDAVAAKVETLHRKGEKAKEDFEATGESLRQQNVQYLHPAIELQELNVERRARLNAVKKKFADEDKRDIEVEEEDVKKLSATTKQAKKTGLASLVSQLSSPSRSTGRTL